MSRGLHAFVGESNRIEGIHRVTEFEVAEHERLLALPIVEVQDLQRFVREVAAAPLRDREGLNVRVGAHYPQPGGEGIVVGLREVLKRANDPNPDLDSPWAVHVAYERLHPFMDGNGRSGRALWAWMRIQQGRDPFHRVLAVGFLLFVLTVGVVAGGQVRSWRQRPRVRYAAAPAPPRDRIKAIGGSNYVTADERYGRAA
jgi:hypothetical protein